MDFTFTSFSPIGSYSLVPSLQLTYGIGGGHASSETPPCQAALLAQPRSQTYQYVGGNTVQLATESACRRLARHKESLECDEIRKSWPAKPSPNPDNGGPIVCCLMRLPVSAGCKTAWKRTRVCTDASIVLLTTAPLRRPWLFLLMY
jgi:hypothetical protein